VTRLNNTVRIHRRDLGWCVQELHGDQWQDTAWSDGDNVSVKTPDGAAALEDGLRELLVASVELVVY